MLTPAMAIAGLMAALCQFTAHHLMRDRHYATPRPRYVVGSAIVCACFAAGLAIDGTQQPTVALIYLYFASYIGTRVGYATDPKPRRPNAADLDKWAATVIAEHCEDEPADRD